MSAWVKLLVSNAAQSRQFYVELGFELVSADPLFTHLRWAPGADVYLVSMPAERRLEGARGVGVLLGFTTGMALGRPDVDVLFERLKARAPEADAPHNTPWHTRELVAVDPDGYRLSFIQPA